MSTAMDGSLNILVVEDDDSSREVLTRLLTQFGYRVSPTASVAEATAAARAARFDLLLTDLSLPDGSGLDLMRGLRGQLPGIAMTGSDDADATRAAGFRHHVTKPILLKHLLAAIRQVAAAHIR